MDTQRQKLVKALDAVLTERDLTELEARLAAWFSRKGCSTTCALPPPKKKNAPARAPARTNKPRPAAGARR